MRTRALLALAMASFVSSSFAAQEPIKLTAAHSGKEITVKLGATFTLTLAENPSTGGAWRFFEFTDPLSNDRAAGAPLKGVPPFKALSSKYAADPHADGMVGSGGMRTWTFRATAKGTQQLNLMYGHSWEVSKENVWDIWSAKITVK